VWISTPTIRRGCQRGSVIGKIDVGPENLEERLSAHHEEFRQLHSNVASEATNNVGEIKFSLSSMADGFTDDGARTDIQSWASSDGPGVVRIHFYYKSHEKAEKRMHDYVTPMLWL